LCNIVGYLEEKADVKTLVEILKDLFFEKHLALTVDFDELKKRLHKTHRRKKGVSHYT
jgi:hypothetical protein